MGLYHWIIPRDGFVEIENMAAKTLQKRDLSNSPCKPDTQGDPAMGEIEMTLLICLAYSDTNDGRGRRYFSYGRNAFFS